MKLHTLLSQMLTKIESDITTDLTADTLAKFLFVSSVHLQRLFKMAFDKTLASYIRTRRLAKSLEKLHDTNWTMMDIAVEYGFEHARSYIRAFKQEYGITPGEARRDGKTIKITPPLTMFNANDINGGLLFGPEIVYVPGFDCVGKSKIIKIGEIKDPAKTARDFWKLHKHKIPNQKNPDIYIGLTKFISEHHDHTNYIPSVAVSDIKGIPSGYEKHTVPSGLCAHFHYIGEHHYMDIDLEVAKDMYKAIWSFYGDESAKYKMFKHGIMFERINTSDYDGKFCRMDWFSPVHE